MGTIERRTYRDQQEARGTGIDRLDVTVVIW